MKTYHRREFLRRTALAGAGLLVSNSAAPLVLTPRRTKRYTRKGQVVFKPTYVQAGRGPHLLDWAYASDAKSDAFFSDIRATKEGVTISNIEDQDRFGINVRWNVEGFGYIYITADNGGEFYRLPEAGQTKTYDLNMELARSRVFRNRARAKAITDGFVPSRELKSYLDLSENYLEDAGRKSEGDVDRAVLAQTALKYAMWAGEMLELGKARYAIERQTPRPGFFIGCDARSFFHMDPDLFMERFTEVFNYATITHYVTTTTHGMPDFERVEDGENFDSREVILGRLQKEGVTVEGRPIFYPYKTVTPDWMRNLSYDNLLRYIERHTREVVGHYGERMYAWEIVNEIHDWANETRLTPEQSVEVTKLACEVAKDTAPRVHRLINNCCPFAEYVQLKKWNEIDAIYPQRTPWEFLKDLVDAGVDFTITGQQMYFPYRDLQDTIILLERYEVFGRPVQLTEVGATSGPSETSVRLGTLPFSEEPYIWHRPWDEELQADWMEGVYTMAYSKPWIEAVNWYDFLDGQAWIKNGGMVRSPLGEKKAIFDRLKKLEDTWKIKRP